MTQEDVKAAREEAEFWRHANSSPSAITQIEKHIAQLDMLERAMTALERQISLRRLTHSAGCKCEPCKLLHEWHGEGEASR